MRRWRCVTCSSRNRKTAVDPCCQGTKNASQRVETRNDEMRVEICPVRSRRGEVERPKILCCINLMCH